MEACGRGARWRSCEVPGQLGAGGLAVPHQAVQEQSGEEADEDVQEPDTGLGEVHAVDGEQEPGETDEQGGTGER